MTLRVTHPCSRQFWLGPRQSAGGGGGGPSGPQTTIEEVTWGTAGDDIPMGVFDLDDSYAGKIIVATNLIHTCQIDETLMPTTGDDPVWYFSSDPGAQTIELQAVGNTIVNEIVGGGLRVWLGPDNICQLRWNIRRTNAVPTGAYSMI